MPSALQDPTLQWLIAGVLSLLILASIISIALVRRVKRRGDQVSDGLTNLRQRVRSWWIMSAVLIVTLGLGRQAVFVFYALLSFLALREFLTLTPTPRGDRLGLLFAFYVVLPVHWLLAALPWYGMFLIAIPVYAFVLLPVMLVLGHETEHFLTRTARLQWGLLVCVYFLSYLPMLLFLPLPKGSNNAALLMYVVIVTQASDVFQYTAGKLWGKRPIAPHFSPKKTVEGFAFGGLAAVALGTALWPVTPFSPAGAAAIALLLVLAGFFGGLVMSGVKRSLGAKDWGDSIPGHGGVLDRLDSLLFSVPLVFHLTGFYCGTSMHASYPVPAWLARLLGA